MLAGIIFDFDGVIVDSHAVHIQAWRALFKSMGKAVGDEELSFVVEGAKREEILRRFLGDLQLGKFTEVTVESTRRFTRSVAHHLQEGGLSDHGVKRSRRG